MSLDDSSQVQEGSTQARASLRSVFGVLLGFFVLLACIGNLTGYGSKTAAAGPALAQSFELRNVPFGLNLQELLHVLPSGERVFVLAGAQAAEASSEQVSTLAVDEDSGEPQATSEGETTTKKFVDWTLVVPSREKSPPLEVFLVSYPWKSAQSVIARQFQQVEWKELKLIESKGGRTAIDGGKLTWNGYAADYVLDREFRPGLRFQDRLRVNLTVNGQCWVAYGIWQEQEAGSKEPMAELLGSLIPKSQPSAAL